VNCSEVQDHLSAYYDNQLSPGEAARVATHLGNCSSCAAEIASFENLSGLSRQLVDPPGPKNRWEELRAKLDAPVESRVALAPSLLDHVPSKLFSLAASILVAIGLGAVAYQTWFSPGHNHLAMNFAHYLESFPEKPDGAQQMLLAKYDGKPITVQEATNVLGYEPIAAKRLPPDYSLEEVYLLNMPCCKCAQVICKNKAGQSIAIFEHDIDQPVWFGDRPTVECLCHDMPTSVMQVGDRLAATWKEGKRYVTIIGATDLNEVTEFVAHFRGANSGKS
jgi:putative zinc finger protein